MVAGTFNAYTVVDGVVTLSDAAKTNGAAGTISLLFIVFAMIFGLVQKKSRFHGWKETVVGLDLYSSCSWSWYVSTDHSNKRYMDLHYICIYLLYSSTSDVDLKAAS